MKYELPNTIEEQSNCNYKIKENAELYMIIGNDNPKNETDTIMLNCCNGIIFEKDTNKVVCMNQPKMIDLDFNTEFNLESKNYTKEYCEDGTVIRLYNYKDNWYTATSKCINAINSYWNNNQSFDEMFWELFEYQNQNYLDKEYTYIFILKHVSNRIVVKHNKNELVFVSRINNLTLEEDYKINTNINNILYPHFLDPNETISDNYLYRGYIYKLKGNNNNYIMYKQDFKNYSDVKNIRGNSKINMRYLELLNEPESLQLLEHYYSENSLMFEMIKYSLNNLVKDIFDLYVDSHIKHTVTITENHTFYKIVKYIHSFYHSQKRPIKQIDVKNIIFKLNPNAIKNLLHWI